MMKCKICGNTYSSEEHFKEDGICNDCNAKRESSTERLGKDDTSQGGVPRRQRKVFWGMFWIFMAFGALHQYAVTGGAHDPGAAKLGSMLAFLLMIANGVRLMISKKVHLGNNFGGNHE